MTTAPPTRYATSGNVNIAYQVVGSGPIDLLYAPPFVSNIELYWESAGAEYFRRLSSFCRLILFDKRGTGLSDRVPVGTLDERIDDIRAVMDATDSERAALFGVSDGGPMSILFAATYPERVTHLVLCGTFVYNNRSDDEHREIGEMYRRTWGTGTNNKYLFDHLPDEAAVAAAARHERLSASPGAVEALHDMNHHIDVRHLLGSIMVPTLVLHQTEDLRIPVQSGRYIARKIPSAILRELPGHEHFPELSDWEPLVEEVEAFLTGVRPSAPSNRAVATVLFTDIVDSTRRAAEIGDQRWKMLLDTHDDVARSTVRRFGGRWIKSTGDGILATFDGPRKAVSCAVALRTAFSALNIPVRAGLHTGDYEIRQSDITGIAVHIAQRVCGLGTAGDIIVSSAVTKLVHGSGLAFQEHGDHELKGVPGRWQLYAVKV